MGIQSWKNRKNSIFNHLSRVRNKYKGLPIENTIGSCYTDSSKFYRPQYVEIRRAVSEIFDPEHHYFYFLQNMFDLSEPKFLKF